MENPLPRGRRFVAYCVAAKNVGRKGHHETKNNVKGE
jgi:hypothetical protein